MPPTDVVNGSPAAGTISESVSVRAVRCCAWVPAAHTEGGRQSLALLLLLLRRASSSEDAPPPKRSRFWTTRRGASR